MNSHKHVRTCKAVINKNNNNSIKSFYTLIQVMQTDDVINKKVMELLQMDTYRRRQVLNNWLEQLRIHHAPENLLNALACLFDDKVAAQVLEFIRKNH